MFKSCSIFLNKNLGDSQRYTQNKAFTLAEVLITLGIIGVVAAMTIPTLISKTNKQELQTQLKENYSILLNASTKLKNDNSFSSFINEYPRTTSDRKRLTDDLKSYIRSEYCSSDELCGAHTTASGYLTLNQNSYYVYGTRQNSLIFANGAILRVSDLSNDRIYIDINGYYKKPNRAGYDMFAFDLSPDGNIRPANSICSLSSSNNSNGDGCTSYALSDTNPSGNGNYWNDFLP